MEQYNEVMSYLPPLLYMGIKGTRRDAEWHEKLRKSYREELKVKHVNFCRNIGTWVNVRSGLEVSQMLRGLHIKQTKKTTSGAWSTDVTTLKELRRTAPQKAHPFLDGVIELRQMYKLYDTYINFPLDAVDDRIRCSYNLAGTETGRISSSQSHYESEVGWGSGLNLQTLPNKMDPEKRIRKIFIPDEGMGMVKIDLAKAEVYVVAYLSGDVTTIDILDNGRDLHTHNASLIFHKPYEDVTKVERHLGKLAKHAVNYGMTYKGLIDNCLKEDIYLSAKEAKSIIEMSKKASPLLGPWHESIRKQLQRQRWLETPLGRRRWFGGPVNGEGSEGTYREAYAYIPQSTVGQLTLRGMRRLYNEGYDLLLEVHDEVVIQTRRGSDPREFDRLMTETIPVTDMFGVTRSMTIPADVEVGPNYGKMVEVLVGNG